MMRTIKTYSKEAPFYNALIGHLEKKQVASMHPHGPDPICDMRRNVGFYQAKLFLCQWQLMPSL
jgi:hypothetical protein